MKPFVRVTAPCCECSAAVVVLVELKRVHQHGGPGYVIETRQIDQALCERCDPESRRETKS